MDQQVEPRVTVVIASYRWPEALRLSLQTALDQTVREIEVIVVEDGRAHERTLTVGQSNGLLTEITGGLQEGATVIVHPGNAVADGVRVSSFRSK